MKLSRIARPIAGRIAEAICDPVPVTALQGPNIGPSLTDGQWGAGPAGFTQDGTGLHFTGTNSGTSSHVLDTLDGAQYRITWTQVVGGGGFRWQLYGDTNGHLGQTATYNTSGTFQETVTTSAAGSLNNLLRANVTGGTAGSNFVDITSLYIEKL